MESESSSNKSIQQQQLYALVTAASPSHNFTTSGVCSKQQPTSPKALQHAVIFGGDAEDDEVISNGASTCGSGSNDESMQQEQQQTPAATGQLSSATGANNAVRGGIDGNAASSSSSGSTNMCSTAQGAMDLPNVRDNNSLWNIKKSFKKECRCGLIDCYEEDLIEKGENGHVKTKAAISGSSRSTSTKQEMRVQRYGCGANRCTNMLNVVCIKKLISVTGSRKGICKSCRDKQQTSMDADVLQDKKQQSNLSKASIYKISDEMEVSDCCLQGSSLMPREEDADVQKDDLVDTSLVSALTTNIVAAKKVTIPVLSNKEIGAHEIRLLEEEDKELYERYGVIHNTAASSNSSSGHAADEERNWEQFNRQMLEDSDYAASSSSCYCEGILNMRSEEVNGTIMLDADKSDMMVSIEPEVTSTPASSSTTSAQQNSSSYNQQTVASAKSFTEGSFITIKHSLHKEFPASHYERYPEAKLSSHQDIQWCVNYNKASNKVLMTEIQEDGSIATVERTFEAVRYSSALQNRPAWQVSLELIQKMSSKNDTSSAVPPPPPCYKEQHLVYFRSLSDAAYHSGLKFPLIAGCVLECIEPGEDGEDESFDWVVVKVGASMCFGPHLYLMLWNRKYANNPTNAFCEIDTCK